MFSRRGEPPPEDPSVAPVEAILEATASRSIGEAPRRDGRLAVTHVIWLCACETMDESAVWLIYTVGEAGIGWQRIPAGMEVPEVVEAEHVTGGHPAPREWLRGDSSDPWRGRGNLPEDAFIFEELRRRIRST
jgi:hypothetical protein